MNGHVLTADDLTPYGIRCQACDRDMQVGDTMVYAFIAVTEVGDPILGDGRCAVCFDADLPIEEAS